MSKPVKALSLQTIPRTDSRASRQIMEGPLLEIDGCHGGPISPDAVTVAHAAGGEASPAAWPALVTFEPSDPVGGRVRCHS